MQAEPFVARVLSSRKYAGLSEETVADVLRREAAAGGNRRRVEERARRRLHRIWAEYLGAPDHDDAVQELDRAFAGGRDGPQIRETCRAILAGHDSARERLPILEQFYAEIFRRTGPARSILDLACALNPLAFRWMSLEPTVCYRAFDINSRTVALVQHYFGLEGLQPLAEHRDIMVRPVRRAADVGLLLKMYHCLEHRRRGAGWEAVAAAPVGFLAVSFPSRNLAGRAVDIAGNYEPRIRRSSAERCWSCERIEFEGEVVLMIGKGERDWPRST